MEKTELQVGMVVQLDPEKCKNPMLAACMMTVSEPKSWGAQGYIKATGEGGKMGGQAYYRATWEEMELVGRAVWLTGSAANAKPSCGTPSGPATVRDTQTPDKETT